MTDTQNLGLHTWAPEDPVDVTEVNENFTLLDQSCAGLSQSLSALTAALGDGGHTCRISCGSYVGSGQVGATYPNVLHFDFTPAVVILSTSDGVNPQLFSAFVRNAPLCGVLGEMNQFTWGDDYVSWYYPEASTPIRQANASGYRYYYVALGYSE